MGEARCSWGSRWWRRIAVALVCAGTLAPVPARATIRYGALQISGNFQTQNLVRHPSVDKFQFVQNRNTFRLRIDWDWLKNGRLADKFNVPFIDHSKLYMLYRGVYDGFYDIAPTDLQLGQTRYDDFVGGPIAGNPVSDIPFGPKPLYMPSRALQPGSYSRFTNDIRSGIKYENVLREAYVDLQLKGLPLSFRLGRQQVIWGETDQFRMMDIWNPLDTTWHFQQESWDDIRIPLWLAKGLWDLGQLGPFSNSFLEVVYNPFDFQPNAKVAFLPRPWGLPFPDPLRQGQVLYLKALNTYVTPQFNLEGTSYRDGNFHRNPADASEVGARFHGVTPQGIEFTVDYLYARSRGIGANAPFAVKFDSQGAPNFSAPVGVFQGFDGVRKPIFPVPINAHFEYPYNHIFGLTGNYFDGDYTAAVFRFETAYALGEPEQRVDPTFGLQFTKRDVWAGMVGFDRPTWIRFLNPRATWFLTGQFFWNYTDGNVNVLRGNSGAGELPYATLTGSQLCAGGSCLGGGSQGLGFWESGPFAGLVERTQSQDLLTQYGDGDTIHRWEHLVTLAATSFYRGGTIVPFVADAWDFVNDNDEILWNVDYYYSNNFIITLEQKFYTTYGSKAVSNDPWFAGGRFARRDETGVKLTYQF
jgi:Protein of unknown function (DUF1302)